MSKKDRVYGNFANQDDIYLAQRAKDGRTPRLPAGVYTVGYAEGAGVYFKQIDTNSDNLLKLPSKEFRDVVNQIETFLKPETRALFEEYGYLYKRSALLYGPPGTGKTCIVNQVADHVKKAGGVVLFNPDPNHIQTAISMINDIQPQSTVLVIFEELDTLLRTHEGTLLSLLDGEVQKDNIIYMATTNYIDRIPARIRRPGRFSSMVEIGYPNAEVRDYYLNIKLPNKSEIPGWVETTEGLSIDELKEVVLAVKCLGNNLKDTVERVRAVRGDVTKDPDEDEEDEDSRNGLFGLNPFKELYAGHVPPAKKRKGSTGRF